MRERTMRLALATAAITLIALLSIALVVARPVQTARSAMSPAPLPSSGGSPIKTAPPMDIVWFRLPKHPQDPRDSGTFYIHGGHFAGR